MESWGFFVCDCCCWRQTDKGFDFHCGIKGYGLVDGDDQRGRKVNILHRADTVLHTPHMLIPLDQCNRRETNWERWTGGDSDGREGEGGLGSDTLNLSLGQIHWIFPQPIYLGLSLGLWGMKTSSDTSCHADIPIQNNPLKWDQPWPHGNPSPFIKFYLYIFIFIQP